MEKKKVVEKVNDTAHEPPFHLSQAHVEEARLIKGHGYDPRPPKGLKLETDKEHRNP